MFVVCECGGGLAGWLAAAAPLLLQRSACPQPKTQQPKKHPTRAKPAPTFSRMRTSLWCMPQAENKTDRDAPYAS